jgi:hypothetical protein
MLVILLVLGVGMVLGAVLADRLFHAGATSASRRALERLEYTLDGLETAYSLKAARLGAQHELADLSGLLAQDFDDLLLHLPQRNSEA